jgi:hypothetical protein
LSGLLATFACQHDNDQAAAGSNCGGLAAMSIPCQCAIADKMEEAAAAFPSHIYILTTIAGLPSKCNKIFKCCGNAD